MKVVATLTRAFAALTPTQKGNLRHHLAKRTPIGCGGLLARTYMFRDSRGRLGG